MNFKTYCNIKSDISTIEKIIASNIFYPENKRSPFVKAAFIELLICLRDLMHKTEKNVSRIDFTDDIKITAKIKDISDLIKFSRDALCHPDSDNYNASKEFDIYAFCIIYGKGNFITLGSSDALIKSKYEDDTCFSIGEQNIYLKHHIIRALNEAKDKLNSLIQNMPMPKFPIL